jgi:raffinose/stachyose/melibiose transport system permease protein
MKTRKSSKNILTIVLAFFAIGDLFPLIWLFDFSLAKNSDLFGGSILILPHPIQWANYATAWVNGDIFRYLINSIVVNFVTIFLTTFFAVTMAYAFTRMKWKFGKALFAFVMIGIMIPIHATLLPNYIIFNRLKLTDTYFGLIIPYVAFALPQATFIMTGFMHSVPLSVEESAILDGCDIRQLMFRIIFPIVRPAMVTVVIMTFISTWNEFIMAMTYISDATMRTLPFSVYNFAGQYSSDYAVQFAVMVLVALPCLIIYAFLSDKITAGITDGALKG